MLTEQQVKNMTPEEREAHVQRIKGLMAQGHTYDPADNVEQKRGILPAARSVLSSLPAIMYDKPELLNKTSSEDMENLIAKEKIKSLVEQQDPLYQAKLNVEKQKTITENLQPPASDAPQDKEAWLAQLSPKDATLVKAITDYNYDIYRGLSFKDRERVGSLATMYDPTFSMAEFNARQRYKQDFGAGKIGANIRSYNTVLGHLGSLMDSVENPSLPSNPIKLIEKGQRGFASQFMGDSPSNLAMADENSAISAVAGELATVFKNSGGTDQEIDKWFKSYDKDAPREYKQTWIKKGLELVQSRMEAIGYDYDRVMGKPYEKSLVSPKSEKTIKRITSQKVGGIKMRDAQGNEAMVYPDGSIEEL